MSDEHCPQHLILILLGLLAGIALFGCGGASPSHSSVPPSLALSVTPATATVAASTSIYLTVSAAAANTAAIPTITLGTLPAGITTSSTFPMSVPASGATIVLTTSSTIAPGNVTVSFTGTADTATATSSVAFTVVATPPGEGYFTIPLFTQIELQPGGSASIPNKFTLNSTTFYDLALSVAGLPTGVTATISPQIVAPGGSFTVTLNAASNAPPAQNVQLSIVGTPTANIPPIHAGYLLYVMPPSGGAGWSNRTSYLSTRATPISAVYDPAHQMIYSANQVWNRVDVISDVTHAIVKSIPIRDPRTMDISVDGSTIWVGTGFQVMYGINTTTQKATSYQLPSLGSFLTNGGSWEGEQVLSLADGTVWLLVTNYTGSGSAAVAIWNPASNSLTPLTTPSPANWGAYGRSQDGKHIFIFGSDENETSYTYDVVNRTFTTPKSLSSFGYATTVAANLDGSRVAVADSKGLALYDGNLNLLGQLPGDGGWESTPAENILLGGFIFSPDGTRIYEETESTRTPVIITIDVATRQAIALSPAMPVIPTFTDQSPAFDMPLPFAIDSTGMLLGIEYHGIAFDDATINFNFAPSTPGSPTDLQHMSPYSGPLAGGTTSGGFGNAFALTPDVYYGATKGTASLSSNALSITSPSATSSGPVDIKILFPDGNEVFDPQFFTYGVQLQDALISGGSPQGGVAAKLDAFGLPDDPSKDTVAIGGSAGTVTSQITQYPPFTGEQTDMFLSYTTPPGSPGWQSLTLTTPNGSSTLPKVFFYAKSVDDYSMTDSPTFVLYDKGRNQVYLSAGGNIDVFSLNSRSFLTPLNSPASGSQFQGLSLTPDGKTLLAADLANGAVAVINPDAPSSSYEIPLSGSKTTYNQCAVGPLFVVPDNQGNALVTSGAVVGTPSCGPQPYPVFVANLAAKSATKFNAKNCGFTNASFLSASHDGSLIGMTGGFKIYLPTQNACIPVASPAQQYAVTVSGDGNVLGLDRALVSPAGYLIGRFAYPKVFYPAAGAAVYYNYSPYQDGALQNPAFNDAGSLYYWAYPNYIDIVDVQHGMPALRFGLAETVTNTVAPMAIDSGGQQIFLITNKGLTVVDLGTTPLSIGHINQSAASPGTQITVRGSGFENGITATLGGVAAMTTFTDSETITITVPAASPGPEDLILSNPDGTSYTLQNAFSVQ